MKRLAVAAAVAWAMSVSGCSDSTGAEETKDSTGAEETKDLMNLKSLFSYYILEPGVDCNYGVGDNSKIEAKEIRKEQKGRSFPGVFSTVGLEKKGVLAGKKVADTILTTPTGKKVRVPFLEIRLPHSIPIRLVPKTEEIIGFYLAHSDYEPANYTITATDEYVEYAYESPRSLYLRYSIEEDPVAIIQPGITARLYYTRPNGSKCGFTTPILHIVRARRGYVIKESERYQRMLARKKDYETELKHLDLFMDSLHLFKNTVHIGRSD